MDQSELVVLTTRVLEAQGIPCFVTGSAASIYYGEPRFISVVDIVVRLDAGRVDELWRAFPEDEFYLSRDAMLAAVRSGGQFNLIHPSSGLKVDFMVASSGDFDVRRFERVVRVPFTEGADICLASIEDVIVKTLEYFGMGRSEKHLRDIAGILRINGDEVDLTYVEGWAIRLGFHEAYVELMESLKEPRRS